MDWTRGQTVGQGSSATVSIAKAHHSSNVFAVKSAELSKSEFLKREQKILSEVRCPHIIAYQGSNVTIENGKQLYNLCMEFASGGTLTDAIRRQGGHLDEATIGSYTCQILKGLVYLHSHGIVHCDIKGSNVLITSDGVKIGDLGCAKIVDELSGSDWYMTSPIAGTPLFMAPEVARGEQQGYPADVWSLGCTVIEMATGQAPWRADVSDPVSALYRIGFSGDLPEIPSFMSKEAKDFLEKCLKRDPLERWSASELLDHAFLKEQVFFSKEFYGPNSGTPTSVLDQIFWEFKEELVETTTRNSTRMDFSNSSPMERIRQLSGGATTSSLSIPEFAWAFDENWVTVRSNDIKEVEMLSCSQDYDMYADEPTTSEGVAPRASQAYNLLNHYDPIGTSEVNTYNSSSSSSSSCSYSHMIKSSLLSSTCKIHDDFCEKHIVQIKENLSILFLYHFEWFLISHKALYNYYRICQLGMSIKWAWAFMGLQWPLQKLPKLNHRILSY